MLRDSQFWVSLCRAYEAWPPSRHGGAFDTLFTGILATQVYHWHLSCDAMHAEVVRQGRLVYSPQMHAVDDDTRARTGPCSVKSGYRSHILAGTASHASCNQA